MVQQMKNLGYAAVRYEQEFGVEGTGKEFVMDLAEGSLDSPSGDKIEYEGSIGLGISDVEEGVYIPTGDVNFATNVRTMILPFLLALDGYTYTEGTDSTNTHEIYSTANTVLRSSTFALGKDIAEHKFKGCSVSSLNLEMNNEFVQLNMSLLGKEDDMDNPVRDIISEDISNLTRKLTFKHAVVEVDYEDGNGYVPIGQLKSLTLNVDNNTTEDDGWGIGSEFVDYFRANGRSVEVTSEVVFNDMKAKETFWGAAGGRKNSEGVKYFKQRITLARQDEDVTIEFPKMFYNEVSTSKSGKEQIVSNWTARSRQGDVTLDDGTTKKMTDIYVKINSNEEDVTA